MRNVVSGHMLANTSNRKPLPATSHRRCGAALLPALVKVCDVVWCGMVASENTDVKEGREKANTVNREDREMEKAGEDRNTDQTEKTVGRKDSW